MPARWASPAPSECASASADVVVEDDCESIGGNKHTTAFSVAQFPGRAISCVIVPEFGGLTHLPDDPQELTH